MSITGEDRPASGATLEDTPRAPRSSRIGPPVGIALLVLLVVAGWSDRSWGWSAAVFDAIAHLFYEQPVLAAIRRPSQLMLARAHAASLLVLVAAGLLASRWLSQHARRVWAVFCVAYAIRAVLWIAGGNLPLIPGDSCHYLEVATSVYRGEGPVKHYVESFFSDYPAIRQGRGVLDDWATPLFAYLLAIAYRVAGVVPGRSLEATVAVAKGLSFLLNLLCFPAIYGFARRRFGPSVALGALAVLAVLPVHAIYGGLELRESLVALTSILAVWSLTEVWHAEGARRWGWAILGGVFAGLAILARNTAMALIAAGGLYALVAHGRRHLAPLLAWGIVTLAVIAPWAWQTYREYGEPFHTYTKYFQYNYSWTVHHFERGNTRPGQFYTRENAPAIARIKLKSALIIAGYSTMIVGLPLACGFFRKLRLGDAGRDADRLVALIFATFVLATLANIADVTQVAQLGRYYLPVYVITLPTAVAGLRAWLREHVASRARPLLAASLVALLWADPTWAYDASWLVKPYQLHLEGLRNAGHWMKTHPESVPPEARVMTWFPWELRVVSDRTTILMPRSYFPPHLERTMRDYGVTHVLWGSFEPPAHSDPETWGRYLDSLRIGMGLTDDREIYRSPAKTTYPVRLYRLRGGRR